ncbi:MAG: hypothetical protein J0H31_08670 [Alphaproteobacteria bacterium]|nr:hypothetical protein [Alphaproteobacteria bacterium]
MTNMATTIGMTYGRRTRRIALRQVFRGLTPPLVAQSIIQMKSAGLLFTVAAPGLLCQARSLSSAYKPVKV